MHAAGRRSKGDDRRRARNKARDSYDVRRPSPANNRMDRSGCGAKLAGIAFAYVRHLHGPTPRATRARGTCDPRLLCRWGAGPAAHARGCSGSQPSGVTAQTASLVGVGAPPCAHAGLSDVDRCHSVSLLLGFDTSRRQMCSAVAFAGSYR